MIKKGIIVEYTCSRCRQTVKYGKEVKGKFVCNTCLSGRSISTYHRGRGFERSYLKVDPRG